MLTPTMTGHQAEALAAYLVSLRPGQRHWTKQAVVEALRKAAATKTADLRTLEQAALAAAHDPKVVTPDVIAMDGRHWEAAAAGGPRDATIPKPVWCDCGSYHRPDQPCPERMPERVRADATPHLAAMRALMAERRVSATPVAVRDRFHDPKEDE